MNAETQADGLPENASGFCEYLVTQLFAYWSANAAMVIRAHPSGQLEALGAAGWLAQPPQLAKAVLLAQQEYGEVLSKRNQLLFSGFENRLKPEFIQFFEGRCKAGFWVNAQVLGSPGGLFVAFNYEFNTDAIEQIRLTFPILRASLKMFLPPAQQASKVATTPSAKMLTPRQTAILELMSEGHTYRQISKTLFTSESTVKQEAKRIFQELGVSKRLEAVRLVHSNGK